MPVWNDIDMVGHFVVMSFLVTGCPGRFAGTSTSFGVLKLITRKTVQWPMQDLECLTSVGFKHATSWLMMSFFFNSVLIPCFL